MNNINIECDNERNLTKILN